MSYTNVIVHHFHNYEIASNGSPLKLSAESWQAVSFKAYTCITPMFVESNSENCKLYRFYIFISSQETYRTSFIYTPRTQRVRVICLWAVGHAAPRSYSSTSVDHLYLAGIFIWMMMMMMMMMMTYFPPRYLRAFYNKKYTHI